MKIKSIRCVAHGGCSKRVSGRWGNGDGEMEMRREDEAIYNHA
jgi:hypothetical protein